MPKEIVSLSNLTGGINTFANPRNIEDHQFVEGINLDTSVSGEVGIVGSFANLTIGSGVVILNDEVKQGGYGLGTYKVDKKMSATVGDDGEFSVVASFKPDGTSSSVGLLQQQGSTVDHITDAVDLSTTGCQRHTSDLTAGSASNDSQVSYLVIDGQLVVYGSTTDGLEPTGGGAFDPQVYKFVPAGQIFFNNSSTSTLYPETTTASYVQRKFFVQAPDGGAVYKSTSNTPTAIFGNQDWGLTDDRVGLICHEYSQTSNSHVGWGKELTKPQSYKFYASYVYDGGLESMATGIGNADLGGHPEEAAQDNDCTFYAVVRARGGAGSTAASEWDTTITAVRIYYAKADKDQDIKYYIGEFPTRSYGTNEYVCQGFSDSGSNAGYAILYGDKTGKGNASWTGKGQYHYEPPRIFTHAVNSGIRSDSKTTECRFKTGVVLNRKLYVGGISQITKQSPSSRKTYPDRLLKSISNKYGVLPDTEFVDVAIRDGEDIIRLAGIGNMLLQFKQNTLYVISVAGGQEYLAGTYKNMGVRHPNAVCQFEGGVFWVNDFGAYVFSGGEAPINLIDKKISLAEWKGFINNNSIVGYDASNKKFFVCQDCTSTLSDDYDDGGSWSEDDYNPNNIEFMTFNMTTGSWNKHYNTIGEGSFNSSGVYTKVEDGRSAISNFADFVKTNGTHYLVTHLGSTPTVDEHNGALAFYKPDLDKLLPFNLKTKEFVSVNAHQRKSIYGVYITYKGTMTGDNAETGTSYVIPVVKLKCQNAGNTVTTTTLTPKTEAVAFTDAQDWETAHYVVPNDDKADTRNAYGIQVIIEPGTDSKVIHNDFKISDISVIMRLKTVK